MKVLYLSPVLPKRSETFVYREVLGLRARGLEIPVASLNPSENNLGDPALDQLAAEAVPVYGSGMPALVRDALRFFFRHPLKSGQVACLAFRDFLFGSDAPFFQRWKIPLQGVAALALAERSESLSPDAVHVHMAHAAATVGMYAAKALGIPFSFTGHAADIFRERILLREKLGRSRFTACISHWHRDFYSRIFPRPEAAYPIVRCGVDIPEWAGPRLAGTGFHIVSLGRMVPKKGFATLLEALRKLVPELPEVTCTLAGNGPEEARLRNIAAGLPVSFPGALHHRDVPGLLSQADVFVLPCQVSMDGDKDGIPVVLMEAMARGICVVSGDLPTLRELVLDGKTGVLVQPGDPTALADALLTLARQPELRSRLGRAGRDWVQEEFSSAKNLDRLISALS